jgi:predicted acylesterase/phospholipase RssA
VEPETKTQQQNPKAKSNAKPDQGPSPTPAQSSSPDPIAAFRCLSFDGGSAALLTVLIMKQIEENLPGFLAKTDMFAGTSSGSTTALILAASANPAEQLPTLQDLWTAMTGVVGNTPLGYIGALLGYNAVFSNETLKATLAKPQFLGANKMSDLSKKVVAASFNMDPKTSVIFGPAAFSNLDPALPGYNDLAVDVALASSASPFMMPAHNGFIDGGLFANNPSMVAAAQIVAATKASPTTAPAGLAGTSFSAKPRTAAKTAVPMATPRARVVPSVNHQVMAEAAGNGQEVQQLKIFSVGGGRDDVRVNIGNSSWGYLQWIFNLLNPLLAMNVFFQGGMEAVDFQGEQLLAPGSYFRLDPGYVNKTFIPFAQSDPKDLTAAANSDATKALVDKGCQWLVDSGWMA